MKHFKCMGFRTPESCVSLPSFHLHPLSLLPLFFTIYRFSTSFDPFKDCSDDDGSGECNMNTRIKSFSRLTLKPMSRVIINILYSHWFTFYESFDLLLILFFSFIQISFLIHWSYFRLPSFQVQILFYFEYKKFQMENTLFHNHLKTYHSVFTKFCSIWYKQYEELTWNKKNKLKLLYVYKKRNIIFYIIDIFKFFSRTVSWQYTKYFSTLTKFWWGKPFNWKRSALFLNKLFSWDFKENYWKRMVLSRSEANPYWKIN